MSTPIDEFDLDVRIGEPLTIEMVGNRPPPTSETNFGTCDISCTHYTMCCPSAVAVCG